jgi:hypothetical protein
LNYFVNCKSRVTCTVCELWFSLQFRYSILNKPKFSEDVPRNCETTIWLFEKRFADSCWSHRQSISYQISKRNSQLRSVAFHLKRGIVYFCTTIIQNIEDKQVLLKECEQIQVNVSKGKGDNHQNLNLRQKQTVMVTWCVCLFTLRQKTIALRVYKSRRPHIDQICDFSMTEMTLWAWVNCIVPMLP